jgi:hypothetical protein
MFVQQTNNSRFLYQPVGILNAAPSNQNCLDASGCFEFPKYALDALKTVESTYTSKLANATYAGIPGSNLNQYFELFETLQHYLNNSNCPDINLLLKIAGEGLQGSLNAYNLNYINTTLKLNNAQLLQSNNQILAGINSVNAISNTSGQFVLTKSFKIAPLFSYYIMVYGFPAQGVGFDQNKLSMLLEILEDNDIDPYT